jgi:hypothetical protein
MRTVPFFRRAMRKERKLDAREWLSSFLFHSINRSRKAALTYVVIKIHLRAARLSIANRGQSLGKIF